MGHLRHQKLDNWFSANTWLIDFKQRPNCSSPKSWFACLRRDDCVSISRSTSGFSACPICIRWDSCTRNGTLASDVFEQLRTEKLLTYTKGISMSPLRHDLLVLETVRNSTNAATATTAYTGNQNGTPPASEIGHLVLCEGWSYRLQTWVEM